jgi:hypothetical protein
VKKPLNAVRRSRAGKLWVGIDLIENALQSNCGASRPSSNDDGEPSRSEIDEIAVFTVNSEDECLVFDSPRSFPECSSNVFLCESTQEIARHLIVNQE